MSYPENKMAAVVYNTDVDLYGVELELSRSFTHDLSGYLSYTWQNWSADDFGRTHPLDPEEETYYFMENIPRNKVKLGMNYKLWEGGVVTLNAQYVDERESKNGEEVADFITMDVGAKHTFHLTYCDFILNGYVNNVTDEDYEMRAGYPMPGITAGISGTLSF
jgi:outer membrane receptor protein involved in Fe transport